MLTDINNFSGGTFEEIKQDILNVLSTKPEFIDYDFTGSRLNTLIDVWAYSILYTQSYSNTALMEAHIQTANQRNSIVQHAQSVGYIPASIQSSTIRVFLDLTYQGGFPPPTVTIPYGFKISGKKDSVSYSFVTTENIVIKVSGSDYNAYVDFHQGAIIRQQYNYDQNERLYIKDVNCDRKHIRVTVNGHQYSLADNMARVNADDRVFYTRETLEGWTEVFFGKGEIAEIVGGIAATEFIGGLFPLDGDTVVVEFLSTKGEEANNLTEFTVIDSIQDFNIVLTVDDKSFGGGDKESTERIRLIAPKFYEMQNRCVTASDYETLVLKEYGNSIESVKCYGNSNNPGYVFLAIKPINGLTLADAEKSAIITLLKKYNIITITPIIVDPDYLFIKHYINIDYAINDLFITTDELTTKILAKISEYYDVNVKTFTSGFHVSKLLRYIDDADTAILGSSCEIELIKETSSNYTVAAKTFSNPLNSESFRTDTFKYYPDSNDLETFQLISLSSTSGGDVLAGPFTTALPATPHSTVDGKDYYVVGDIDYTRGDFTYDLDSLGLSGEYFESKAGIHYAVPTESDIYVTDNNIIAYEYDLRPDYLEISLEGI